MISRRDPRQFGSFDGLDNRKAVMDLFVKMGDGIPEELAMRKRARFLQGLLGESTNGFADKTMQVTPCTAVQAYHLFISVCANLGVEIETAARKLEAAIR